MLETPTSHTSPEAAIRAAVLDAARRRRAREAGRLVWRLAPPLAAGVLAVSAVAHLARLPAALPLVLLGGALVALIVCAIVVRRPGRPSDAVVGAIDREADLGGELQSANWFAARGTRDPWAEYHVAAAARRIERVDWSALYPPARAGRARLLTALSFAGALLLALTIPEPVGVPSTAAAAAKAPVAAPPSGASGEVLMVPPELQRRLQELLAAAERGDAARTRELASEPELREMLNRLAQINDAELLEALARAMAAESALPRTAAQEMDALAERARQAAAAEGMSQEMRQALESLADGLEIAKPDAASAREAASPDGSEPAEGGAPGTAGGSTATDQLTLEFSEEADGAAGAGMMVALPEDTQGAGPPGAGFAGGGTSPDGAGPAGEIEAALRQEMVDASAESAGGRVAADIRRRTEQGDARVSFTRDATRTFDTTRAVAPPPVPEARRAGVQTYFHRTP